MAQTDVSDERRHDPWRGPKKGRQQHRVQQNKKTGRHSDAPCAEKELAISAAPATTGTTTATSSTLSATTLTTTASTARPAASSSTTLTAAATTWWTTATSAALSTA